MIFVEAEFLGLFRRDLELAPQSLSKSLATTDKMKGIPFKGITLWTEESREAEIAGKKDRIFPAKLFYAGDLILQK